MSNSAPKQKDEIIRFVGVNELSAGEQEIIKKLTTENYLKIKRDLQDITNLVVHVKFYAGEGSRKKYSMHVRVAASKHNFESTNADDWEIHTALHKAFEEIKSQIHHKLHTDVTRPR